jgi:hypothetical protein
MNFDAVEEKCENVEEREKVDEELQELVQALGFKAG